MPLALITGASAGIGREIARALARRGFDLALAARRAEELRALAAELEAAHGVRCRVYPADLAAAGAARALADAVAADGLPVDVLVNNAGFGVHGPFAESDPGATAAMLRVNVVALTELTQVFLPQMVARGSGRVLNVASVAAFQPGPMLAAYSATKAFVFSLSRATGEELRGTGVTVTALCPGPVRTEFAAVARMADSPLFAGPLLRPAAEVAEVGVRAVLRGDAVAVPGFLNRLLLAVGHFTPTAWKLRAVRRSQAARGSGASRVGGKLG